MATFTPTTGLSCQTSPGTPPTMKNKDGSTINSGGAAGTLGSVDQTQGYPGVNQPASFTIPPAVPPLSGENTSTKPGQ